MKKIVSKDLDFDSQLEDILSLDRGIPSDISETVKNIIEGNKIKNKEALANPECLKEFRNIKDLR